MISLLGDTAADNNRSCFQNVSLNSRKSDKKPILSDTGPLLQSIFNKTYLQIFKLVTELIQGVLC